jgi:hypothetical protein
MRCQRWCEAWWLGPEGKTAAEAVPAEAKTPKPMAAAATPAAAIVVKRCVNMVYSFLSVVSGVSRPDNRVRRGPDYRSQVLVARPSGVYFLPLLSLVRVMGPPVRHEHGTGLCPIAGRAVMVADEGGAGQSGSTDYERKLAPDGSRGAAMRSSKLAVHAVIATIAGVMASAASLLLRAWTLDYWQAWVFIVVFVGSIGAIGTYLALNDPWE